MLLRGPQRLFGPPSGGRCSGSPRRCQSACCPTEIEKTLAKMGDDGEKVRGTLERDFAEYVKKAEKRRGIGLMPIVVLAFARPMLALPAGACGIPLLAEPGGHAARGSPGGDELRAKAAWNGRETARGPGRRQGRRGARRTRRAGRPGREAPRNASNEGATERPTARASRRPGSDPARVPPPAPRPACPAPRPMSRMPRARLGRAGEWRNGRRAGLWSRCRVSGVEVRPLSRLPPARRDRSTRDRTSPGPAPAKTGYRSSDGPRILRAALLSHTPSSGRVAE